MIALIPARAGSTRIPGKNMKLLGGYPLIAYTIAAAQQSRVFDQIIVCTDDPQYRLLLMAMGVTVCARESADAAQTDITWLREVLPRLPPSRSFALLRPTSPFRTAATIRRAYREFHVPDGTHDSLRAVQLVAEHPGKMWTWEGPGYPMRPLFDRQHPDGTPWHSSPTQSLPPILIQNASLEMSYTSNVEVHGTLSGRKILPFLTYGYEGVDLNTLADWDRAEALCARDPTLLPPLGVAPVSTSPPSESAPDSVGAVARGARV